jgi:hypothetical protein
LLSDGHGRIEIDLLEGSTTVDGISSEPFEISGAVRSWLDQAKVRDQLEAGYITEVKIACDFDVADSQDGIGKRRELRLHCTVSLDAQNGSWTGTSQKAEIWRKSDEEPWIIRDA